MKIENLEIYRLAKENSIAVYHLTLNELPKFEMFETGAQIRRAAVSVRANIVEGYWRRKSQKEFVRFLRYAHSSNHEVIEHLKLLWDVQSLKNEEIFNNLHENLEIAGKKIYSFIQAIEKNQKE